MILFLKNIHSETKKYEIASFIDSVIYDGFLLVEDIKIFSILDINSNTLETHGLVNVPKNEVAKRIIKKLDGMMFKGKSSEIREYANRSLENDPRDKSISGAEIDLKERRDSDRRRKPLMNSWQNDHISVHG